MSNSSIRQKQSDLKPLSEKELDDIFSNEASDQQEATSVGRSYGWSDQQTTTAD